MAEMGIAYSKAKKFSQAEKCFLKALKLLPRLKSKHPERYKFVIFFNLMTIYKDWGKEKEARKYAKKALYFFRFLPPKHRNSKAGKIWLKIMKEIAEDKK